MARGLIFLFICCLWSTLSATEFQTFNNSEQLNLSNLVILYDTTMSSGRGELASKVAVQIIEGLGKMDDMNIQKYTLFPFNRDTSTENAFMFETKNISTYKTALKSQTMKWGLTSKALLAIKHTLDMVSSSHSPIILVFTDSGPEESAPVEEITATIKNTNTRVIFFVDYFSKRNPRLVPQFNKIAAASKTQIFNFETDVDAEITEVLKLIREIVAQQSSTTTVNPRSTSFSSTRTIESSSQSPTEEVLKSSSSNPMKITSKDNISYESAVTSSTGNLSENGTTLEDTTSSVTSTAGNPSNSDNTSSAMEATSESSFIYNYLFNLSKTESLTGAASKNNPPILGQSALSNFFTLNSSTNIQGSISFQSPVLQTSTNFSHGPISFVNGSNILCSVFGNAFCTK